MSTDAYYADLLSPNVDPVFDSRPGHLGKLYLPLPFPHDSLPSLRSKLRAVAAVAQADQSVAAATGYLAAPKQERDPETAARLQMTAAERDLWDAYSGDTVGLPKIDWETNRAPAPTSPRPLKIASRRAEALNRIYNTTLAEPGHAVWFSQNHLVFLPLVKAMARVIGAERDLVGGMEGLSPGQLAEIQSITKIIAVVAEATRGKAEKKWPVMRDINRDNGILLGKLGQLRGFLPTRKRKRELDDE